MRGWIGVIKTKYFSSLRNTDKLLGLRLMFDYNEGWMNEIKVYIVKICTSVTSLDEKTLMFNRMKTSVTWLDKINGFEFI